MRYSPVFAVGAAFMFVAAACGDDDASPTLTTPMPEGGTVMTPDASSSGVDSGESSGCPRVAKADDRVRKVVVSHPNLDADTKAKTYEVLELSTAGDLTTTNETFEMGVGEHEIVFTPDGEIGLVAQRDGSIGAFGFDDAGKVRVIHAAFTGTFFASHIVIAPDGARAWVLDANTAANGGGVHEIAIACDGTLSYVGRVVSGGAAHAMALLPTPATQAVLLARTPFDAASTDYGFVVDLTTNPLTRVRSGAALDADAIASWVSVTPDGKWALVTDDHDVGGPGNRIAPIALDTMTAAATLPFGDPAFSAMSPFGNAAVVTDSFGNAIHIFTYDASNAAVPFTAAGEVTYAGAKPELPTLIATVDRGTLKGRVLISEVTAVRQLSFAANGTLTDLAKPATFTGIPGIVGSLGIQP